MILVELNRLFWDYFKQCPRKACLAFRKNHIMHLKISTFKFLSVEQQRYKIFEKTANSFFYELITNKELNYSKFKEYFYSILLYENRKMKNNGKYSKEYKNEFSCMLNDLKDFGDFERLAEILDPNDTKDLEVGGEYTFNLTEYLNRNHPQESISSLKELYSYKLDIPFYRRRKNGVEVIKYIHSGYPYNIVSLDNELNILKAFFNKSTEENLLKIIVYDFKTFKRYEVTDMDIDFNHMFRMLKVIESQLVYVNNTYENCITCLYKDYCRDNQKFKKKTFEEIDNDARNKKKRKRKKV